MRRYYSICFIEAFREAQWLAHAYTDVFKPEMFVDCVLQQYVDMNVERTPNAIRRTSLSHQDLIDHLEEFAPNYLEDGSFHLPPGTLEAIHKAAGDISTLLTKTNYFLLSKAQEHGVDLQRLVSFSNRGSVYVLSFR